MQLRDNVVDQSKELLDDSLLVVDHLTRHLVDAHTGVRVDLGGNSLSAAYVLRLEVLEAVLALAAETLDLLSSLILGLFQTTGFA